MGLSEFNNDEINNIDVKYKNNIFYNIIKTIFIMTIAIVISFIFRGLNLNEATIILVYLLGVLFSASRTDGYLYGILASIIGVLSFNFFFTEPYYTLIAYRADYPITFFIMLITSIITSALTSKVKEEAMISLLREKRIELLYESNKKLLKARNKNQVIQFCGESLVEILDKNIIICIEEEGELQEGYIYICKNDSSEYIFKSEKEKRAMKYAFDKKTPVGIGTSYYKDIDSYYYPIKGQSSILGVIGITSFNNKNITRNEKILIQSVSTQLALAMEREYLFEKNEKISLEAEKERLRSNLLRSISHDLRTPLTSILGSVSTIIDNDEILDTKIKRELLKNIYEDTIWLSQSFENILSMTKIDEGRLEIKKSMEVVDEIVVESISRVKQFSDTHNIKFLLPDEIIAIEVDGLLIEQVLVNLIQNAIRYTPNNSTIEISIVKEFNNIIFEVKDNGSGILEEDIDNIFNRFYTKSNENYIEQRGIGLGLAICKSIINAHNGDIKVYNNELGGATFRFNIPIGGEI